MLWVNRNLDFRHEFIRVIRNATTVDGNGKGPGMNELIAVGKAAGMSARICRRIAMEIQEKTVELERRYRDCRS